MFLLCYLVFLSLTAQSLLLSSTFRLPIASTKICNYEPFHSSSASTLYATSRRKEPTSAELDNLKLNQSTLDQKEKDRIDFIQKISLEADDMIRAAGIDVGNDADADDDESILARSKFVQIKDTQWTGQSNVEITQRSSNNYADLLNRKGLVVGDVLSFLLFAFIGKSQHSADDGNQYFGLLDILITAAPFLVAWLVTSPFLGAYNRQATSSISAIPVSVLPALILSTAGGVAIRTAIKGYMPPIIFAAITLITTFVLIASWRVLYIKLNGETNDNANENKQAGAFEVFKMIGTLIKRW